MTGRLATIASVVFAASTIASAAAAEPSLHVPDWFVVARGMGGIDFTPHGTQPGLEWPLLTSEECASCHATSGSGSPGDPVVGGAFRPFSTWAGSMMANATRDPLFWAALDVANHDVAGAGDYCLRCHTSRGWYAGRVVKNGSGPVPNDPAKGAAGCLLEGAYDAPDDITSDYGGVACHYCHRLMPTGPNGEAPFTGNGNAWVDDAACADGSGGGPCRRGPYDYAAAGQQPPHEWAYSDFHTQSAICGTCHDVSTPDTDAGPLKTLKLADGSDTGLPFPIERTYGEWLQSSHAQAPQTTCQACHMPQSEDPGASACLYPGFPDRAGDLPVHAFVGGNTWIPGIVRGQYAGRMEANGGASREAAYRQTVDWARDLLGRAARVETAITGYVPPGAGNGMLSVRVKVTNESGHKLPSGYGEGRRMWLNLQVRDAAGALVFESGAYDAATGVLSHDPQLRVYEVLQGIWNHLGTATCDVEDAVGNAMFHFVLNDCIAKDNRIPPLGFRPATAADPNGYALRPVGATYPETVPGSGVLVNYDSVDYAVPVPPATVGPLTATARLYYQTSSREYVRFLRDQAVADGTPVENAMCDGGPNRPFDVGPQQKSRGQYVYDLWNDDRIYKDGYDPSGATLNYGKSPPELMQYAAATATQ